MNKIRLAIVQSVLPLYSISFFNRIVELYPQIDLIVFADIRHKNPLNQFEEAACFFRVVQLDNYEFSGLTFRGGILKALRSVSPDVVVFSGSVRDVGQLFAMLIYWFKRKPFATWGMFHRVGSPKLITNIYFRFVGVVANLLLAYTRVGATNLVRLRINKRKIVVVGTAIDEKIPQAEMRARTPEDLKIFRQELGLADKQLVLQVVRLSRIKRPELLVYAAAEICKVRDDVVFAIVGDGEMRQELISLIERLELTDSFKMLGSIYDESVLSYWYLTASAFVVPTFIGLSAHHAMSYGVPIVTDDSLDCQGSEFDILANGLNALLYKEGDAQDMARVLTKLLSDTDLWAQLSANARSTVERVHNLDNKTHQFVSHVVSLEKGCNP